MIEDRSLVSGGDCFSHWHSEDRRPTQSFLHGLQDIANQVPVSGPVTLKGSEDFVIVDTGAGNVTVTLPKAIRGIEIEVMKLRSANTIIVLPQGTDTILGMPGATITSGGASIRFKAVGTDWKPI